MPGHKDKSRVPLDAERFKKALAKRRLKLEPLSRDLGFSGSYLSNRLRNPEDGLPPIVTEWLQNNHDISPEEYAPVKEDDKKLASEEANRGSLDYEKLYDVIYRAMKAALEETFN